MSQTIIEVTLRKRRTSYIATCKLFPKAKGIGKTKDIALKKLSSSIASNISKMISSTLNNVFDSNNYTQVLFDQSAEPPEERIAFNLSADINTLQKSLFFKVSSFEEEEISLEDTMNDYDIFDPNNSHNIDENDAFEESASPFGSIIYKEQDIRDKQLHENDIYEQFIQKSKSSNEADGYVFGFPLNFN